MPEPDKQCSGYSGLQLGCLGWCVLASQLCSCALGLRSCSGMLARHVLSRAAGVEGSEKRWRGRGWCCVPGGSPVAQVFPWFSGPSHPSLSSSLHRALWSLCRVVVVVVVHCHLHHVHCGCCVMLLCVRLLGIVVIASCCCTLHRWASRLSRAVCGM